MSPPCPPRRWFLARGAAVLALPVVAAVALASPSGCSDSSTTTPEAAAPGNPTMSIVSPSAGKCFAIGDDPDARLPVVITTSALTLRPPGLCGTVVDCGHVVVRVDGVENNIGGSVAVDVLVRKLADRYGEHSITVEIVDDSGEVVKNKSADVGDGIPLTAMVSVITKVSCDEGAGGNGAGGGGTGGAGGGGTGGAGGGGTGGAGGGGTGGAGGSGTGGAGGSGTGGAGGSGGA